MANIITGVRILCSIALLFLDLRYTVPVACTIATFAAIQEGYFIRQQDYCKCVK